MHCWSWDQQVERFVTYYRGDELSSHICVLFNYDGVILRFTAREQEDVIGLPLDTSVETCLSHTRVYYYDKTFGRCEGAMLFATDLPMKTFICVDGTPLTELCTRA